jgi:hypothetical protein
MRIPMMAITTNSSTSVKARLAAAISEMDGEYSEWDEFDIADLR